MLRPSQAGCLIAVLLAIGVPGRLVAQGDVGRRVNTAYLDISIEAASHLRTAASYVAQQSWPEAIDLYDKLIQSFGDKVVQVGSSPVYVSVRDYCHMQILALPPAARQLYRKRADAQAEAWYRTGRAERDSAPLTRVVERAFASSWGDDAIDALAELAFEAGRFDEAHALWRRIDTRGRDGAPASERPALKPAAEADDRQQPRLHHLIYPDTDLDRALIDAKKILCRIFRGEPEQADQEIAQFRQQNPNARGTLGAVNGLLADLLSGCAREHASLNLREDGTWATFAGNVQRSKVVAQPVDVGSVQWSVPLPQSSPARVPATGKSIPSPQEDSIACHPIVAGGSVLVCGRDEVRAYDLHEGPKEGDRPAWAFRLRDNQGYLTPTVVRQAQGSPQHTLTAEGDRLYVRLGSPETTISPRRLGLPPDSNLVCLDLTAEGKEQWRITPERDEPDLAFEGSPVVAGGNVYIGVTRGGAMTHSFVACYEAATGAKKWRQLICESASGGSFYQGSISHNLLTLGAGMVFYNTNTGAVAALDQASGRVRWIATYERDETAAFNRNAPAGQELDPCIYHDGVVVALPSDSQGVYAFDALTGELRWRTLEPPRIKHMLGVAHGKLICTGNQVMAIDLATGRRAWQWPEGSGMTPNGRGILAGNYVYFPTKTHIHILDQETGEVAKPPVALVESHSQPTGNLVIADGYLVVAQAKSLTVFCQYEVLINRYRDLIAQNPEAAEPHFRLARAAEAINDLELAVKHYRESIRLSRPSDTVDGRVIQPAAQTQLYTLLLQLAAKSAHEKQWSAADRSYRDAAAIAPTEQAKLDALLRVADLWTEADDGKQAITLYQELLADESIPTLTVKVDAARSVRADVEIANRVQTLLDRFGRGVFAPYERAARAMLIQAQQSESLPAVERVIRRYPNAELITQARLYLAAQYAEAKQFALASAAYKQVLAATAESPDARLAAMHGLAQIHEAQRTWSRARGWWLRLAQEFPNAPLPTRPEQSIGSFVKEHLSRTPYDENGQSPERVQFPLSRRWTRAWGEKARVLIPDGEHPADTGLILLSSDAASLRCISGQSGDELWQTKFPGPVRWATFHDGRLLVGADTQLASLDINRGELLWRQVTEPAGAAVAKAPDGQPAVTTGRDAKASSAGVAAADRDGKIAVAGDETPAFSEFRLVDDRLLLRDGGRRLVCLSADTGAVQWSYAPTDGAVLPYAFFSGQRVALAVRPSAQPEAPRRSGKLVVLDADGRLRLDVTQPNEPWKYPPVPLDSHRLCIATDTRTLQLIDLTDGKPVWSFASAGADHRVQPIAGAGGLLVLVGRTHLVRLNSDTGQQLWSHRISDDPLPDSPHTWSVDDDLFCCVTRELNLRAFRLTDGELAWQQSLFGPGDPGYQWQVTISDGYVVALPNRPSTDEGLPVVFCRGSDGALIQRLLLRPRGSESLVHVSPQLTLVGSEREVWALSKQ